MSPPSTTADTGPDIRPARLAAEQYAQHFADAAPRLTRTQALVAQQRQFLDDASHQLRTHLTTLQLQIDYARRAPDPAQVQAPLLLVGLLSQ